LSSLYTSDATDKLHIENLCAGHMGFWVKKIRVVLPSCAVSMVKSRFPAPDGSYTCFQVS